MSKTYHRKKHPSSQTTWRLGPEHRRRWEISMSTSWSAMERGVNKNMGGWLFASFIRVGGKCVSPNARNIRVLEVFCSLSRFFQAGCLVGIQDQGVKYLLSNQHYQPLKIGHPKKNFHFLTCNPCITWGVHSGQKKNAFPKEPFQQVDTNYSVRTQLMGLYGL